MTKRALLGLEVKSIYFSNLLRVPSINLGGPSLGRDIKRARRRYDEHATLHDSGGKVSGEWISH
jgi:hypothetical protein